LKQFKMAEYINFSDLWEDWNLNKYKFTWVKKINWISIAWFIISNINSKNKISTNYYNCISVIWCWVDEKTWKNISFLTHQDTSYIENNPTWIEKIKTNLDNTLKELQKKCIKWTIDIVILGWNDDNLELYTENINLIKKVSLNRLNFKPIVIWWPSMFNSKLTWSKSIFFENNIRWIHYFKEYDNDLFNKPISIEELIKTYPNLKETSEYKSYLDLTDLLF
jgi:hypothetical protein